jgi:DNA-binding response OmpR family regulator
VMSAKHVMVVEDDANTLSGYLEFLSAAGFEPLGVSDGAEALKIAMAHPPAAVVTDITLPGMNGFALATALRHDTRTREVPVIGLTAFWGLEVRGKAAECRMRAVLAKPCMPAHLVAELHRVLASVPADELTAVSLSRQNMNGQVES